MEKFDGKEIRDEILKNLADKVAMSDRQPVMAVFLIGDDPVCRKYVELKEKLACKAGIQFCLYKFGEEDNEQEIIDCIKYLNNDKETDGIMIQIPVAKKFSRENLIQAIDPKKDIDGLRFCQGLDSDYLPPVVLAILEAINRSNKKITEKTKIMQVGKGFLVGAPLEKAIKKEYPEANLKVLTKDNNLNTELSGADIIISATGKSGIIKEDMAKEGVVLIDAGTAEENGELKGDIDPEVYKKSSYYTPVPGGIGPVTVAMLFRNLVER